MLFARMQTAPIVWGAVETSQPINSTAANNSARIYGIAPPSGAGGMVGSAGGTLASRGP